MANTTGTLTQAQLDAVNNGLGSIGVEGDLFYRDATGLQKLAKGTSGQTLEMGGSNAPEWVTVAAPESSYLKLINSAEANSSSSVEITGMTTTYDSYLLIISRLIHGNDNSQCSLQFSTSGGYISGGYISYHGSTVTSAAESYASNRNSGIGSFPIPFHSAGNVSGEAITASLWIHNATSNLAFPMISGTQAYMDPSGNAKGGHCFGSFEAKHVLTALKVVPDAGTITSGRVSLYGLAHA